MCGKGGPCIGEGGIAVSRVKYYVKYLVRMFASLSILLSSLSGAGLQ